MGGNDIGAQTRDALRRIAVALTQAGADLEHVVHTRMSVTNISRWQDVAQVAAHLDAVRRCVIGVLRNQQQPWKLNIRGRAHGSQHRAVDLDEARAVVQLAVAIVQWGGDGQIVKK